MTAVDTILLELEKTGQSELVSRFRSLDSNAQKKLADQLDSIDFKQIQDLYSGVKESGHDYSDLATKAEPAPAVTLQDLKDEGLVAEAKKLGEDALKQGKVGFVLVAGGQGTRLGFDKPKGMYPIGPLSGRTLFQMMTDLLKARSDFYGKPIPLYLMTSPATDDMTRQHFGTQSNFGLAEDDFRIFCQGTMPAVDDQTGHVLFSDSESLFESPDGHGGMLKAFNESGCLSHAEDRGIEYLFYCQIDNPLAQICDPVLVGLHILRQSELTTQVVRKSEPLQRVGNVMKIDGRVQIVEYSDLPQDVAEIRNDDGSLKYWAGSIAVHVFDTQFLAKSAKQSGTLPFHVAHKKVPYLSATGQRIQPEFPNAFKFEQFIFDLLPSAKRAIVVEVADEDGFAAVKNSSSATSETPETTKAAIVHQHRRWLTAAGIEVDKDAKVEIHPSAAHDLDSTIDKLKGYPPIHGDTYIL